MVRSTLFHRRHTVQRPQIPQLVLLAGHQVVTLTDWVRNERFVELFEEGHRYYDLRRWAIAPQMLKAGMRYGLDGLRVNPSFEEFNKPTLVNQPFKWDDKLYLMPVWSRSDMDELYSNPQLVQAPGY